MAQKKVTFHRFRLVNKRNHELIDNSVDFDSFIEWFTSLPVEGKMYRITNNKFTSLDYIKKLSNRNYDGTFNLYLGMFSTGNHGSRRDLKNSENNTKRPNPKRLVEGEEQENYFLLKLTTNGSGELIYQSAGKGVRENNFENYFDIFLNRYLIEIGEVKDFNVKLNPIISTDDVALSRLDRIVKTRIYVDKSILSDDGLGYSNRLLQTRQELYIDVRAEVRQSIRDVVNDLRQAIMYKSEISNIWIEGKDIYGNQSNFFLDQVKKRTFIDVEINPLTAAIHRESIKSQLLNLL